MMDKEKVFRQCITFCVLFAFWILLSGYLDAFHLIAGAVCSAIVTFLSYDFLITKQKRGGVFKLLHFSFYCGWLFIEIFRAGFDVAYRVLHPHMPIDPQIVTFETPLTDDIARTVLANSITLTPGTITIDVNGGTYTVHALTSDTARDLTDDRTIEKRVARIFLDAP
ncbi:MAG: Na+/H+ antiporter subunit E [Methanoregula sp.]|nr:Na+/H+ antiporter subunit E [Methanoregula sp.]